MKPTNKRKPSAVSQSQDTVDMYVRSIMETIRQSPGITESEIKSMYSAKTYRQAFERALDTVMGDDRVEKKGDRLYARSVSA
jgi:hypothetical protein